MLLNPRFRHSHGPRIRAAGWSDAVIPKFHWCVHFPHHLSRWKVLPTCWAHERKHKIAKRYASEIRNTGTYSASVLSEILAHQLHNVAEPDALDLSIKLVNPSKAKTDVSMFVVYLLSLPDHAEIMRSSRARISGAVLVTSGDVVLIRYANGAGFTAGRVLFFVSAAEMCDICFFSSFTLVSQSKAHGTAPWRVSDTPDGCDLSDILAPTIWRPVRADVLRNLIPYEFGGLDASAE